MLVRITQVSILFFLLAVIVFFLFIKSDTTKTDNYLDTADASLYDTRDDDFADSDGDGIPNWEEKLYGSSRPAIEIQNQFDTAEVVTEETKPYVFDPRADGLVDVQKLIETINGGGEPSQGDLQNLLGALSSDQSDGQNATNKTAEYLQIKTNLNAIGSPMIWSVSANTVDRDLLVANLNGESTDLTAISQLEDLYQTTAQRLANTQDDQIHNDVAPHLQILISGFVEMARALGEIRKGGSTMVNEDRAAQFETYNQAQDSVNAATVSLHNLVTLWGITFEAGESGKYFAFTF